MLAYKVMESHDPKVPVGTVFIEKIWHGPRFEVQRYDWETLCFVRRFRARYLGRVTGRTERARIKSLLALPGMAAARRKAKERGFYKR